MDYVYPILLTGTENCGLDILSFRIKRDEFICNAELYGSDPSFIEIDFGLTSLNKFDEKSYEDFITGGASESIVEWFERILGLSKIIFIVFRNYLHKGLSENEVINRLNLLSQTIKKLEVFVSGFWKEEKCFFLVENLYGQKY